MEVEMKMVKSLLLGTTAGLVAVAGAQAADMPVKAAPVQYVKICSLYGDGFYYIPNSRGMAEAERYLAVGAACGRDRRNALARGDVGRGRCRRSRAFAVEPLGGMGRARCVHCYHPGRDALLCRNGLALDFRNFPGHDRVVGPGRRARACCRAEHIYPQAATGACPGRPHAVRAHPFARSAQGLV